MVVTVKLLMVQFHRDDSDLLVDEAYLDGLDIPCNTTSADDTPWPSIRQSILKFIQPKDRALALASILLKSRVYHEVTKEMADQGSVSLPRPIMDLPRTQFKKPYIPLGSSGNKKDRFEALSVSHQFPFAGIAWCANSIEKDVSLGFDIVAFDKPNARLYDTTMDFVHVFRDQFTDKEWQSLMDCRLEGDERLLREFYLRWAIKEAYTKALGVGMGIEFSSFDFAFDQPISKGIWAWVLSGDEVCARSVSGVVRHHRTSGAEGIADEATWTFTFVPLPRTNATPDRNKADALGCGCICVGPSAQRATLEIDETSIEGLLSWHVE